MHFIFYYGGNTSTNWLIDKEAGVEQIIRVVFEMLQFVTFTFVHLQIVIIEKRIFFYEKIAFDQVLARINVTLT